MINFDQFRWYENVNLQVLVGQSLTRFFALFFFTRYDEPWWATWVCSLPFDLPPVGYWPREVWDRRSGEITCANWWLYCLKVMEREILSGQLVAAQSQYHLNIYIFSVFKIMGLPNHIPDLNHWIESIFRTRLADLFGFQYPICRSKPQKQCSKLWSVYHIVVSKYRYVYGLYSVYMSLLTEFGASETARRFFATRPCARKHRNKVQLTGFGGLVSIHISFNDFEPLTVSF